MITLKTKSPFRFFGAFQEEKTKTVRCFKFSNSAAFSQYLPTSKMSLCLLTIVSLFFMTASSQDAGSLRKSHCELYTLMLDYLYCTTDCPVSYLVSASDVLSNVSVLHALNTESLVQDVVSFDSIYCDQYFAAVDNIFTLKFSEQVLVNRIRVSGLQSSAFVSNFSLLIQENSTGSHNQFDKVTKCNMIGAGR